MTQESGRGDSAHPAPFADLLALGNRVQQRLFTSGTRLVRQGETGQRVYYLLQGRVRLERAQPYPAEPLLLGELGTGSLVGDTAALDGLPQPASALADGDVEALELDLAALPPTLRSAPRAAVALLRVMGERQVTRPASQPAAEAEERVATVRRLLELTVEARRLTRRIHDDVARLRGTEKGPGLSELGYALGICQGEADGAWMRLGGLQGELHSLLALMEREGRG